MKDGEILVRGFTRLGNDVEATAAATTTKADVGETEKHAAWYWYCAPDSWETEDGRREGCDGSWQVHHDGESSLLTIHPPAKKDFWRKTYYQPAFCKDDGPVFYTPLQLNRHYTIQTCFSLQAASQFDQAGLFVRLDSEHWLKAGIEVVDGIPRLSAVVCNVYSDWSTQPWKESKTVLLDDGEKKIVHTQAKLRIHCRGTSLVVEACPVESDDTWQLVRIAHLSRSMQCKDDPLATLQGDYTGPSPPPGEMWVGPFACSPADQRGCKAVFWGCTVQAGSQFDHHADENQE